MCCFHILRHPRDWDVEVEVEGEDCPGDEDNKDGEGGILKVSDLNLHWSELDTPADLRANWRGFEAHMLPVGGLKVFKMVSLVEIEFLEIFVEDDNGIANKQVGEVCC